MNYIIHYENLINRAKERTLEGYKESHHIIPKCLGGTDERDNLVNLTAREHFIAHLLLWKINPESYGLIKAIQMMCVGHNENRSMNRMYGWLKERHSKAMSVSQTGESNSQFGTMWIHNLDLKESKRIKKDEFPVWEREGWLKGRVLDFTKLELRTEKKIIAKENKNKKLELINNQKEERIKSKLEKREQVKRKSHSDYILFREVGFEKFKEITNYNSSFECLIMSFRRNADNYESKDHRLMGSKSAGS